MDRRTVDTCPTNTKLPRTCRMVISHASKLLRCGTVIVTHRPQCKLRNNNLGQRQPPEVIFDWINIFISNHDCFKARPIFFAEGDERKDRFHVLKEARCLVAKPRLMRASQKRCCDFCKIHKGPHLSTLHATGFLLRSKASSPSCDVDLPLRLLVRVSFLLARIFELSS